MNEHVAAEPTRCLLVHPAFSNHSYWNYSSVCQFVGAKYPAAPLGLMTVAALLPQHWQFRLIDENVTQLTDAHLEWADMVCTGGMLPQQKAILTIISKARDKGKLVVVGGPDPTSQPDIYAKADFLVLGEGEVTIPLFLEDLHKGMPSGRYESPLRADMTCAVVPRFDLVRFSDYLHVGIQFSRGCPFNCEFCDIIELFGRQPRTKSPEQILKELKKLHDLGYRGHVDFVDDNFIGNKPKVMAVLQSIRDWSEHHDYPFYFSTEASINLAKQDELLQLMQENDFRYVFIGIESPDDAVLAQAQKMQNKGVSVVDAVKKLAAHGIIVTGGFILGFDNETESTAQNLTHLIQASGICMAMVGTLYALPNTQLSRRLVREGRAFNSGLTVIEDNQMLIDQTTCGLNFVTTRPRASILVDHMSVLRHIYAPENYYDRVLLTALNLVANRKHHPRFTDSLKTAWSFLKICRKAGFNRHSGVLYWKTLLRVLAQNRNAVETVVNLGAMYTHFSQQSAFAIQMIEENVAHIDDYGEENYNALMLRDIHDHRQMIAGMVQPPQEQAEHRSAIG